MHLVNAADALELAAACVEHVGAGVEFARIDANESQTAHERIGSDLERETAERIVPTRPDASTFDDPRPTIFDAIGPAKNATNAIGPVVDVA